MASASEVRNFLSIPETVGLGGGVTINPPFSQHILKTREALSPIRQVFQTTPEMKGEFTKFLKTIFFQLDEKKVLQTTEKILADPSKTDEQVYQEIVDRIDSMKKSFAPLRQLWALRVVKLGMARQAKELMKGFENKKFQDYLEVYNRRYCDVLRKVAHLPLGGRTIALADFPYKGGIQEKLEAGSLFSKFPYKEHIPLNDPNCTEPSKQPELTARPINPVELGDKTVDLLAVLGGLHHIPEERLEPFVESLHQVLKPGAVLLLRDHDAGDEKVKAIAAAVHTFVNATAKVCWQEESREIRAFKSLQDYKQLMIDKGFDCVSPNALILKDDPTRNGTLAFVRRPTTEEELEQAISYRNDPLRSKQGTRATWIEWGNVRSSKQYAEYIQNHPAYSFDSIGHLRQHFRYFFEYIKECRAEKISWGELLFSTDMAMNLFILLATAVQCSIGTVVSIPSRLIARMRYGKNWADQVELSTLDKYDAKMEKEYSEFIDHTPFYSFGYIQKIKELWNAVLGANEGYFTKITNIPGALLRTFSLLIKSAVSAPVRAIFTSQAIEPDKVRLEINDPKNLIKHVQEEWARERGPNDKDKEIGVIFSVETGRKYLLIPRYRPCTEILKLISKRPSISLINIGGNESISVDVLFKDTALDPSNLPSSRLVYQMPKLQDKEGGLYATYQVATKDMEEFIRSIRDKGSIEYIHE